MVFIPGPPDAALSLQASVTKTANFYSTWFDLGQGFAPGGLGMAAGGVVNVSAITVDGDQTYSFKLQETGPDAAGNPVNTASADIGVAVIATAAGVLVPKGLLTNRFVRLALTVTGSNPSITFAANLNP